MYYIHNFFFFWKGEKKLIPKEAGTMVLKILCKTSLLVSSLLKFR